MKVGTVALAGRPNAGKSTLMNRLLEEKVAIVSDKPQTTRHRLVGILTEERGQIVFHDSPGMHKPMHRMNRRMVQEAEGVLVETDLLCLLVDATAKFGRGDDYLLDLVAGLPAPKILLLTKIDLIKKSRLLPLIEVYHEREIFEEILPISALTGDGLDVLLEILFARLPEGEYLYDPELLTIHPERYLAAERIREKVLERTEQELPFSTAVVVEKWEDGEDIVRIWASILVDREGQKKIVIGKQGSMIKAIGIAARKDLEEYLGTKVYLELYVKYEPGWRENPRILAELEREVFRGL